MATPKKARSTKPHNDLTAKYVRSILNYDPKTGIMQWRVKPSKNIKAGAPIKSKTTLGYLHARINGTLYYVHRLAWLIMTGAWPTHSVDHKNTKMHDNRWNNLRKATHAQNMRNSKKPKTNTSGLKGAHYTPRHKKPWRAAIYVRGKTKVIGQFDTREEAHAAYQKAAKQFYKEFARFE